jgi:serine/threonine protein phosphatase PrpC
MRDNESSKPPAASSKAPFPSPLDYPAAALDVEVVFGARSRPGSQLSANDDHYLILRVGRHHETLMTSLPDGDVPKQLDEYGYGMVIADGMGRAGELASRLAVATLVNLAIDFGKWYVRVNELIADEMMDRAERFYRSVDSLLQKASRDYPRVLQTTMTAIYTAGSELLFAHVGHSRAYVFREGHLMRLTRDHTLGRGRPGKPRMVDVSASAQDQHHVVTETLGMTGAGALRLDIERCGLQDGDLVLLCTNGLTDVAEDAQIADALLVKGTPDDQCAALLDLATSLGATDDVTALVAHYRIHPRADVGANP